MIKFKITNKTSIEVNNSYEGETLETKIERITTNKEPITDGAPIIYTDRKNGVEAQYDIRTDRFEIAIEAMNKVSMAHTAKRENYQKEREDKQKDNKKTKEEIGSAESTQATE